MPDPAAYHRQVEAARAVGLAMTRRQGEAFVRLLEQYAEDLASRVSSGVATRGQRHALAVAQEIIEQMVRDMALTTRNGVVITANRVASTYAEATASLLASRSGAGTVVALFPGLGPSAAQAVLSRPELAASFRTVRRSSVAAADQIIGGGLLRGATSTQIARELRLHVLGADAFPESALLDRRRIGYRVLRQMGYEATPANLRMVRARAGKVAARANLIARTEPMNAEMEAHRQGAVVSDVVASIKWELSSSHPTPDECDALQDTDFYGLGSGVYPPESLPRRPHPRCTCRHRDLLRDPEDWDRPKPPNPERRLDPTDVARTMGLPPSRTRALRTAVLGPSRSQASPARAVSRDRLLEAIRAREAEIAGEAVEWATLWDSQSGAVLLNKTDHLRSSVSFTDPEIALFRGNILTHNHPGGSAFSPDDIRITIQSGLLELRAVARQYTYSLRRPDGGWPRLAQVESSLRVHDAAVEAIFRGRIGAGTMSPEEASREHFHVVWRRVFNELGVGSSYSRVEQP